jgi:hypothetical protein
MSAVSGVEVKLEKHFSLAAAAITAVILGLCALFAYLAYDNTQYEYSSLSSKIVGAFVMGLIAAICLVAGIAMGTNIYAAD